MAKLHSDSLISAKLLITDVPLVEPLFNILLSVYLMLIDCGAVDIDKVGVHTVVVDRCAVHY